MPPKKKTASQSDLASKYKSSAGHNVPTLEAPTIKLKAISADLYDKTDPRSLVNMLPKRLLEAFESIMKHNPEVINLSEDEAFRRFNPSTTLCRIRFAFWREYEQARSKFKSIDIGNIATVVKLPSFYIENLLSDTLITDNLAFVLTPPTHYENIIDEALSFGIRRLREEIMTLPFKKTEYVIVNNVDGSQEAIPNEVVDHKAVENVLKAIAFVDMRLNGGIVQKNIHLHKQVTHDISDTNTAQRDLIDIDKRIKELEAMDEVTLTILPAEKDEG